MYKRYTHGCAPVPNKSSVPYCRPISSHGSGAIPESVRMATGCNYAWIQTVTTNTCDPKPIIVSTIVNPGAPYPLVPVGTTPASRTIQQQKQILENDASNPYNPETRFSQYFPAPPIPYCPPMRVPNNDPKPSTRECVPIRRFQGSSASQ